MNTFKLHLQSSLRYEKIDNIISFTGKDASGSFSIMANAERFMTSLEFGLVQFRYEDLQTEYVALPGAILYFHDNELFINTWSYQRSKNYNSITKALNEEFNIHETTIQNIKETLNRLDEKVFKRLWELERAAQL